MALKPPLNDGFFFIVVLKTQTSFIFSRFYFVMWMSIHCLQIVWLPLKKSFSLHYLFNFGYIFFKQKESRGNPQPYPKYIKHKKKKDNTTN
jgi:hypothetical protein